MASFIWTSIQKKEKYRKIPLWQGGVHEAKKNVWSLPSKLELVIWRHVDYVSKSSITFRWILICLIFSCRDMQDYYMLFGIFTADTGLYSMSVFFILCADFQFSNLFVCIARVVSLSGHLSWYIFILRNQFRNIYTKKIAERWYHKYSKSLNQF